MTLCIIGTALFIFNILQYLNIFNVKTTGKGIHKRLPDCDPIRGVNGHQMIDRPRSLFLGFNHIHYIA